MRETWIVLLVAVLVGRLGGPWAERDDRGVVRRATAALESRWIVWGIAITTAAAVWIVWGQLQPAAMVHDEAAYLLQARTYAMGRLANPAPVIPDFFEQFHVLVTPTFAAKYPPGTALSFVPGVWLGVPALMPLLLAGAAGALLFLVARRLTNPWLALLVWGVWITAPATLDHAATFFSQNVTVALWLAGWWMLLEWRDTNRTAWLVALSVCTAWMAVTRPFTAVAYAIPTALVVLVLAWRRRAWRSVVIAAASGAVVLAVIPVTSRGVLGDWRRMPWSVYAQDYMPSDRLGFGLSPVAPRRALPEDMQMLAVFFAPIYQEHLAKDLPYIAARRGTWALSDMFRGRRLALLPFAVIGLTAMTAATGVAVVATVLAFGLYLLYGHAANWTLYYVETQPVLAFLAALGLWRIVVFTTSASFPRGHIGGSSDRTRDARAALAVAALALLVIPHVVSAVSITRFLKLRDVADQRWFFEHVAAIPERSIVFVRYGPKHKVHRSLIANEPDLAGARAWIVYDRGRDNARLIQAAPDRVPYLYDEETHTLVRYAPLVDE